MPKYYFESPSDLLNKTKRDYERIKKAYGMINENPDLLADHFFNFCITAFSIRDWLKNSNSCSFDEVKNYLEGNEFLSACRDICNTSKHYELLPNAERISVTESVETTVVRHNGMYRRNDEVNYTGKTITVRLKNGSSYPLNEFCTSIIGAWESFFASNNI